MSVWTRVFQEEGRAIDIAPASWRKHGGKTFGFVLRALKLSHTNSAPPCIDTKQARIPLSAPNIRVGAPHVPVRKGVIWEEDDASEQSEVNPQQKEWGHEK